MKLARVTHIRCSEPDGQTFCFIPDDWTENQFNRAVYAAKKKYEAATSAYMEELKAGDLQGLLYSYSYGHPQYERYPDKTVKEVKEAFEQEKEEKKRRKAILDEARKPFGAFLRTEGVRLISDLEEGIEIDVNWGHQHGVPLDYREEWPESLDKQGAGFVPQDD